MSARLNKTNNRSCESIGTNTMETHVISLNKHTHGAHAAHTLSVHRVGHHASELLPGPHFMIYINHGHQIP